VSRFDAAPPPDRRKPDPLNDSSLHRLAAGLDRALAVIAWIGRMASWLLIPILLAVLVTIAGSFFRVTHFMTWEGDVPLFGAALTLNSILDLQWYLFGILLMLTGAYALQADRHVRVDVFSQRFSRRTTLVVEILGDLIFLLPLCIMLIDRSLPLVELAFTTGERSNEDGMTHRWLIKMFVPIGFSLLAATGVLRILRNALRLRGIDDFDEGGDDPGDRQGDGRAHLVGG